MCVYAAYIHIHMYIIKIPNVSLLTFVIQYYHTITDTKTIYSFYLCMLFVCETISCSSGDLKVNP